MKDDHITSISDFLLICFTLEVDLYASDEKLWEAILSCVKEWNGSQADSTARSSLLKAGQLLHKTETGKFRYKLTKSYTEQRNQMKLLSRSTMQLSTYSLDGSDLSLNTLPLLFNYAPFLRPLWNTMPKIIC